MPQIGSTFGRDHHRAGRGAAGVGVFLRRADSELLNGIERIVLEESADVVVGVVYAVNREFVVQP